jgi:hypothetical protein
VVTLAPTPVRLERDAAAARKARSARTARTARTARVAKLSRPRQAWWQWLDFDCKLMAQVWSICCAQILVLAIGGLVIHASAASPY